MTSRRNDIRHRIIGKSPTLQNAINRALTASRRPAMPVLLYAERGTGKELFAQLIHQCKSPAAPFVPTNLAALSPNLVESELFGHVPGAFTSATRRHVGYIEKAHDGTLFLDELDKTPFSTQPKLLRFLQEGEITPVGGDNPLHVKVRIIAATNCDLEKKCLDGTFHADLLDRIYTYVITIPPLRERKEDILLLASHFLNEIQPGKTLSPAAETMLVNYDWPGNVRELKSLIQAAEADSGDNQVIDVAHIKENWRGHRRRSIWTPQDIRRSQSFLMMPPKSSFHLPQIACSSHLDADDRRQQIVEFLKHHGPAKPAILRNALNLRSTTLNEDARILEKAGIIKRTGHTHTVCYAAVDIVQDRTDVIIPSSTNERRYSPRGSNVYNPLRTQENIRRAMRRSFSYTGAGLNFMLDAANFHLGMEKELQRLTNGMGLISLTFS